MDSVGAFICCASDGVRSVLRAKVRNFRPSVFTLKRCAMPVWMLLPLLWISGRNTPDALTYPGLDTTQWIEISRVEPGILLDLRYATEHNFVQEKMYDCGRCLLRKEVGLAVIQVHKQLCKQGLGLKMFDCYRPRPVQWRLWKKVPDPRYVADPRKGSMHNRGSAVDLTIVDAKGKELDMGTGYDFFGPEAYHNYMKLPEKTLANRRLLKTTMENLGFRPTSTEWWHYSYRLKSFPLSDMMWDCP